MTRPYSFILRQSVTGADFQRLRRLPPVAAKPFERALDHGPFLRLQVERVVRRHDRASARPREATRGP